MGVSILLLASLALVPQPKTVIEGVGICPSSAVVTCTHDAMVPSEGYRLSVTPNGIGVWCSDDAGLFYARQTLSQLRQDSGYSCVEITDSPTFKWRGLLVDESRHFFGKEVIMAILDQMATHKLNVFHWHLTDDQGWRIDVPGLPELVRFGSARQESPRRFGRYKALGNFQYEAEMNGEKYGPYFYTEKDLREVVAYAADRHITIVPEVDFPGHFRSALAAYPDLSCFPSNIQPRTAWSMWGISTDVLCIGNDGSIELVKKILDYICDVFPSKVIHIGGDECPRLNWERCPKCRVRMENNGLEKVGDLQAWFTCKMVAYLASKGRRAMGWDEMLGSGDLPRSVIGQSWRAAADEGVTIDLVDAATGANRGHDMVVNPHVSCYFNYMQGVEDDPFRYADALLTLKMAYAFDPLKGVPFEVRKRVLGSEACLWSVWIATADELAWKMWPRTCATAEVLWSYPAQRNYKDFCKRMSVHRRRLIRAGVNCAPIGR